MEITEFEATTRTGNKVDSTKLEGMPIAQVIDRIIRLNDGLRKFWTSASGWTPIGAAQLLSKSRLDWQVSLSHCLKIWPSDSSSVDEDGRLILAWANLGSLVEGTMKLFLSVYYEHYERSYEKEVIQRIVGKFRDPDTLHLEKLRQFFEREVWAETQLNELVRQHVDSSAQELWDEDWSTWIESIQHRRNAIHSYQDREIGTLDEFFDSIRMYLKFLRYINSRLPYLDEMYVPRET